MDRSSGFANPCSHTVQFAEVVVARDVEIEGLKVTVDERDEVDRHTLQGADLLEPLLPTPEMLAIVRHHHERFDGTGYPDGRRADGRVFQIDPRLL